MFSPLGFHIFIFSYLRGIFLLSFRSPPFSSRRFDFAPLHPCPHSILFHSFLLLPLILFPSYRTGLGTECEDMRWQCTSAQLIPVIHVDRLISRLEIFIFHTPQLGKRVPVSPLELCTVTQGGKLTSR